jgi:hypothetical protein
MKRIAYVDRELGAGWPERESWQPYFQAMNDVLRLKAGNTQGVLVIEGVDGTGHMERGCRVDATLTFHCKTNFGVQFYYKRFGAGVGKMYYSKGDVRRLWEFTKNEYDSPLPVAFFIPIENAWEIVKSFDVSNGKLPTSIQWIADVDLPTGFWPEPGTDWEFDEGRIVLST